MKQNRIHIDELVRQRLRGADEPGPPPGAWRAMREKLDGALPIGNGPAGGGGGWGRTGRWTAALLLLACLTTGGYQAAQHFSGNAVGTVGGGGNNSGAIASRTTASPATTDAVTQPGTSLAGTVNKLPAGTTAPAQNPAARISPSARSSASATASSSQLSSATSSPRATQSAQGSLATAAGSPSTHRRSTSASTTRRSASSPTTSSTSGSGTTSPTEGVMASAANTPRHRSRRTVPSSSPNGVNSGSARAESQPTPTPSSPTASSVTTPSHTRRSNGGRTRRATSPSNPATQPVVQSATTSSRPASAPRNSRRATAAPSPVDSAKPRALDRDTIAQIRLAQRMRYNPATRTVRYVTDTTHLGMLVIEQAPAAPIDQPAIAPLTKAPSARQQRRAARAAQKTEALAAAKAKASAVANAAPATSSTPAAPGAKAPAASSAGAGSAGQTAKGASGEAFSAAVRESLLDLARKTREGLSQLRFYSGTTAGLNTAVGGATPQVGFQLGLYGLMAFNERISLGLEAKYVQRFNRGASLEDSYASRTIDVEQTFNANGQEYSVYRWDLDSTNHYFNVPALGSIEAPLYARYAWGKFYGLAGVNFSYSLRANVEEIARPYRKSGWDTTVTAHLASYNTRTEPTVHVADFGPRIGLGYIAGAGYQITPALGVDVRAVQQLWDNKSNTAGGKKVWQTYYDAPSLQVSVGYRFGAGKKRPGIPAPEAQ